MNRRAMVFMCALAAASACDKGSSGGMPTAKGSGPLSPAETALLQRLPAGANVVFGGNVYDAQRWMMNSPIGKLATAMMPAGMKSWTDCLASQKYQMVGAGAVTDGALTMPMFMQGMPLDALRGCATKADLPVETDADGKFVVVEVDQGTMTVKQAYLAVDGGVYTRVTMNLGGVIAGGAPEQITVTRADLERDQAGLASANLASDPRMVGWLAKVNRTKPFFFVGSAEGTAIADKLGMAYGSFDLADGMTVDVTVELREPGAAGEVMAKWSEVRGHLDQIPPSMSVIKDIIKAVRLGRTGDGLRIVARITNPQLEAVMTQLAPMLPQLGR
ncbi:MAG: hypothetical protein R3B06_27710 [Kofleriaceae bacterium]